MVLFTVAMNCLILVYGPLDVGASNLLRLLTASVAAILWELMVRPHFRSAGQELRISASVFAHLMVAILLIRSQLVTGAFSKGVVVWLFSVALLCMQLWFVRMMLRVGRKWF